MTSKPKNSQNALKFIERDNISLFGIFFISLGFSAIGFFLFNIMQIALDSYIVEHKIILRNFSTAFAAVMIESLLFYSMGAVIAYIPFKMVAANIDLERRTSFVSSVLGGLILGVIFTPVSAVPLIPFMEEGSPGYLAECYRHLGSMSFSGVIGGIAFWSIERRKRGEIDS
jgi:hypothetical protein